jgi:hypothetical protein
MHRTHLLPEVARRASVSVEDAEAVIDALTRLSEEGRLPQRPQPNGRFCAIPILAEREADPRDEEAVRSLIEQAQDHPLGVDYLRKGLLASVAATFQVHAFTILAARERLSG